MSPVDDSHYRAIGCLGIIGFIMLVTGLERFVHAGVGLCVGGALLLWLVWRAHE